MVFRVNKATYAAAVAELVELAMLDTGGSRVAAQVLLSAYDGSNYQIDIAGMGNLDRHYHDLAMAVIQGRYDTGWEPHNLIENGGKIFERLRRDWYGLHVYERGKKPCPACQGRGVTFRDGDDDEGTPCTRCGGKRRVCRCGD
jgi:hypothetical protein